MGSGRWSTDVYTAAAMFRKAHGLSAFDYSDSGATATHPLLDPRGVVREARDSDEHPESLAIAVLFDVTGSMGNVPRILQAKLPQLLGLLLRKGYVEHPQILFGAIGDATCDRAPLQIGQFESDNRMDEWLSKMFIEGGGGGQQTESYELAAYFMAGHTKLDCFEKRGRRGYLFIIGDEMPYDAVAPRLVRDVIGDPLGEPIRTEAIFAELARTWDIYLIQPGEGSSYRGDAGIVARWRDLLGQHYLTVDEPSAVTETIALTIGLAEGAIDLAEGLADLDDVGSDVGVSVGRALATVGAAVGSVTRGPAPAGLDEPDAIYRF